MARTIVVEDSTHEKVKDLAEKLREKQPIKTKVPMKTAVDIAVTEKLKNMEDQREE